MFPIGSCCTLGTATTTHAVIVHDSTEVAGSVVPPALTNVEWETTITLGDGINYDIDIFLAWPGTSTKDFFLSWHSVWFSLDTSIGGDFYLEGFANAPVSVGIPNAAGVANDELLREPWNGTYVDGFRNLFGLPKYSFSNSGNMWNKLAQSAEGYEDIWQNEPHIRAAFPGRLLVGNTDLIGDFESHWHVPWKRSELVATPFHGEEFLVARGSRYSLRQHYFTACFVVPPPSGTKIAISSFVAAQSDYFFAAYGSLIDTRARILVDVKPVAA